MKKFVALMLAIFPIAASAQDVGWRGADGASVPSTDSRKSVRGFGGWLLVTPDKDWEEKWNTPSETVPHFAEADDVNFGEELTILTFFSNPKPNRSGAMEVICDIKIRRPDGSYSIDQDGVSCADWEVPGGPPNVMLTKVIIKYVGEAGDLPGTWSVAVRLRDDVAGISLPLRTDFRLLEKPANKPSGAPSKQLAE